MFSQASVILGGVRGGGAWQGGYVFPGACMAGETATAADGTHPTGMHSCNKCDQPTIVILYCCDMGQNDTIGKIELNPSFVLSSVETNCKNDIQ